MATYQERSDMTRIVRKYLRNSSLSAALLEHAPVALMTYEQRRRSRQKVTLNNGETINLVIDRGVVLAPDDVLVADDGGLIVVQAKSELLVRVTANTATDLARAAYHLGNRHVTVEVGEGYLHLEDDPVLVEMLNRLGVHTVIVNQAFNPEHGAYGGGHKHGHDETYDEDYALAQAAYRAHEDPHSRHGHNHAHSHDHDHLHNDGRGHQYQHNDFEDAEKPQQEDHDHPLRPAE